MFLYDKIRGAGSLEDSIVDGPGLRYVLFAQGCPHHCSGCHNPETHDFSSGQDMAFSEVLHAIRKNPLLRGVTFSGGEPFCQSEALAVLASQLKADGYHLIAYTGYLFEALMDNEKHLPFLRCLDLVIDGPFIQEEHTMLLPFRGSRNQRIIDVPASLRLHSVVLHPLDQKGRDVA